jgi:archaellum component FlaC
MVVMPRERWTDEKLDKAFGRIDGDLRELRVEMRKGFEKIDQRFEEMERRFDQVDRRFEQVDRRFEQVDRRFEEMDKRFERVDARFETMHRTTGIWFLSLTGTIIGSLIAGVITALSLG